MRTTTEFLKEKGLIEDGFSEFVIRFSDGREMIIINDLLKAYAKEALEEAAEKGCTKIVYSTNSDGHKYYDGVIFDKDSILAIIKDLK